MLHATLISWYDSLFFVFIFLYHLGEYKDVEDFDPPKKKVELAS